MTHTVRRECPAMATRFEVILTGDDLEHLEAVAAACFEEVERIERLLSRFDPASEVARINRDAHREPVLVDVELAGIVADGLDWTCETGSAFNIVAAAGRSSGEVSKEVEFDKHARTLRLLRDDLRLDFGAYGKGYALDRLGDLVRHFGIASALLNAGASSLLAVGADPDRALWPIGVRDPWSPDLEVVQLSFCDLGFSCSATRHAEPVSDLIDPRTGLLLEEQAACAVLAPDAATAEVLSTAFLVMGRDAATTYIESRAFVGIGAGWIARAKGRTTWEWLTEPVCPIRRPDEAS